MERGIGYQQSPGHTVVHAGRTIGIVPDGLVVFIPIGMHLHTKTIIGYDDMGTEGTQDDVIILADSYDTTDHYMDGYVVESFERLMYGWNAQFEAEDPGYKDAVSECAFVVAIPNYEGMYSRVIRDLGL